MTRAVCDSLGISDKIKTKLTANTRFIALGMANSGKTCYLAGVYYMLSMGYKNFLLTTQNASANQLNRWSDNLYSGKGQQRFPEKTEKNISHYQLDRKSVV